MGFTYPTTECEKSQRADSVGYIVLVGADNKKAYKRMLSKTPKLSKILIIKQTAKLFQPYSTKKKKKKIFRTSVLNKIHALAQHLTYFATTN